MSAPMSLRDIAAGVAWLLLIGALSAVAWFAAGGYGTAWVLHPVAAGALTVSHLAALGAGLMLRDRRRKQLATVADWHDEEIGAIKLADTRRDSGEQAVIEPETWVMDGGVEPRRYPARCDGCGRPATGFGENGPSCGRLGCAADTSDAAVRRWSAP
ncbi:MAG: hypothetical protein ACRD0W_09670 [Acidimicrobiales bacterium]